MVQQRGTSELGLKPETWGLNPRCGASLGPVIKCLWGNHSAWRQGSCKKALDIN